MRTKNGWQLLGMVLIVWGMLIFSLNPVQAASPAGVLKEAIH